MSNPKVFWSSLLCICRGYYNLVSCLTSSYRGWVGLGWVGLGWVGLGGVGVGFIFFTK